jgi:uncharacterized protein YlaI
VDAPILVQLGNPERRRETGYRAGMRRLTTAPNLALAVLWADMLRHGGIETSVQRAFASSIAGEIPPDQALPEIWIEDAEQFEAARRLLHELRHPPSRHWVCRGCQERIDGPFEQCWNCGAAMPAP